MLRKKNEYQNSKNENSLGAIHVGGFKMVIFPKPAFQLIKQYYPNLVKSKE